MSHGTSQDGDRKAPWDTALRRARVRRKARELRLKTVGTASAKAIRARTLGRPSCCAPDGPADRETWPERSASERALQLAPSGSLWFAHDMRHSPLFVALPLAALAACDGLGHTQAAQAEPPRSALAAPGFGGAFGKHWYDGKAELAGYRLRFPRYGQPREGTAVTIFVTEHQSSSTRVKPEGALDGAFPVIKLNLVQDFQTGVYDYNLMTSAFVSTASALGSPAGSVSKLSFSAQEWCGHVYAQLLFGSDKARLTSHSYFEGEADQQQDLPLPNTYLAEDALLHWARGFASPALAPGQSTMLPLVRSLQHVRLAHVPLVMDRITLNRQATRQTIEVPAGRFESEVRTARVSRQGGGELTWTFHVEAVMPHRLLRITRDDGFEMNLTGSQRLPYWELKQKGQASHLKAIGL